MPGLTGLADGTKQIQLIATASILSDHIYDYKHIKHVYVYVYIKCLISNRNMSWSKSSSCNIIYQRRMKKLTRTLLPGNLQKVQNLKIMFNYFIVFKREFKLTRTLIISEVLGNEYALFAGWLDATKNCETLMQNGMGRDAQTKTDSKSLSSDCLCLLFFLSPVGARHKLRNHCCGWWLQKSERCPHREWRVDVFECGQASLPELGRAAMDRNK